MINRNDIVQHSEEWHKIRYGKIGGTLSKGLFVKSDTLLTDLLSELTEDFEMDFDGYESKDMQRGTELEPHARKMLSEYIGVELLETGWLQCEENELIGISPDGVSEDETVMAETKCPSAKKHFSTILNDEIPSDNIHQCLHYFVVNPKLENFYFASFRPESKVKKLFVKKLTRDSLIDLGTKAKPVIKTVAEWVIISKLEANSLKNKIKETLKKLEF